MAVYSYKKNSLSFLTIADAAFALCAAVRQGCRSPQGPGAGINRPPCGRDCSRELAAELKPENKKKGGIVAVLTPGVPAEERSLEAIAGRVAGSLIAFLFAFGSFLYLGNRLSGKGLLEPILQDAGKEIIKSYHTRGIPEKETPLRIA